MMRLPRSPWRASAGDRLAGAPGLTDIFSQIADDGLRRLYLYWNRKRGDRRFPARRDIDPLDFVYILGWVTLVDVTYDPLRFRFRLYGSELAHRLGLDATGMTLDEHPQRDFANFLQQEWQRVVENGEPSYSRYERAVGDQKREFESLRLPLSSDGVTVDMLLAATRPIE